MSYIIAIDQGTTGTTAVLMDSKTYELVDKINKEFPQIFPEPGLVEHNLDDIWETVEFTVKSVLDKNKLSGKDIHAIGITNQRETICSFDKSGSPLANAIVWQDRRTAEMCTTLKSKGLEETVKTKTGLTLDPYFSGTKMKWLLENNSKVSKAANEGNLRFGNIDTFLLYKLSKGESYKTEATNASRTLLMNLENCSWDDELLDIFGCSKDLLPEICDSFGEFGKTKGLSFLPDGIPITCMLGDQQSALFGQAGLNKGDIKCTYGTGSFILLNAGDQITRSNSGLLTTIAFKHNGVPTYALEGSCYIAGAAVQWLRDNLKIIKSSPDIEELALELKDLNQCKNVLFLPFFSGIGSPHWVAEAKAAIVGLTRDSGNPHIARSCLEGIAFSINDLISAMARDTGIKIERLKVDGGAVANNLLMEIQSSISNMEIIRPKIIETTAYGAALGAAIGCGLLNFNELKNYWATEKVFNNIEDNKEYYQTKTKLWEETVKRLYL